MSGSLQTWALVTSRFRWRTSLRTRTRRPLALFASHHSPELAAHGGSEPGPSAPAGTGGGRVGRVRTSAAAKGRGDPPSDVSTPFHALSLGSSSLGQDAASCLPSHSKGI